MKKSIDVTLNLDDIRWAIAYWLSEARGLEVGVDEVWVESDEGGPEKPRWVQSAFGDLRARVSFTESDGGDGCLDSNYTTVPSTV